MQFSASEKFYFTPKVFFLKKILPLRSKNVAMNILKIDALLHEKFLSEEPHDPVTGDLLLPEDEIVLCAVCRTAFLKESWLYIGCTHCAQQHTLDHIPFRKGDMKLSAKYTEKLKKLKIFKKVSFKKRLLAFGIDFFSSLIFTPFGAPFYWLLKDTWGQSLGKKAAGIELAETEEDIKKASKVKRIFRNLPTSLPLFGILFLALNVFWGFHEVISAIFLFFFAISSLIVYATEGIAAANGEERITDILLGTKITEKEELDEKINEQNWLNENNF